ncbi:YggS family pyridoxal phosphate-dependent enzyme [Alkalihalobacillus sp. MEB130]|uniref:YggS family pyridoxal phosphate-dependent enzyme n=1 Tax=Alkalihalobacillus sp. MEB130 TaxID=2976704 RepID=UPI0028DF7BC9|nr:YggS family pyridoxal phosphate-dependent enzyme [Alkalihalobacillus sp. MEB130]MDT8859107.1 YggS family pyridoxal phosphate-dependent enzyme [Alkalihalobacillus sp. MEB130]
MTVKERFSQLQKKINDVCESCNRDPSSVQIVAVTKYVSMETTAEALDAGLLHIGENRTEGAVQKWNGLGDRGIWHFIGSLQSRKVKEITGKFEYLHSLDRLSLAKELDKRLEDGQVMKCFVQVNVSGEQSKSGLTPGEVIPFINDLADYPRIVIVGLMTMAPFYDDPELTRPIFRKLREIRDSVQELELAHAPCKELSMGMSNDYHVAIEEGATFIRIGSALVGKE